MIYFNQFPFFPQSVLMARTYHIFLPYFYHNLIVMLFIENQNKTSQGGIPMKKLLSTLSVLSILSMSAVPAFAQGNIHIVGNGHAKQHININNSVHINNSINIKNISFTDLKGNWAEKAILGLVKKGVLKGIDPQHFRPNEQITREQFATMIAKFFQLKNTSTTQDFLDVPTKKWSYTNIEAAKDYMDAYRTLDGELDFKPGVGIKREDVTVTLVKVLMKANSNLVLLDSTSADQLLTSKFSDAEQISPALRPYVATAVQAGLIHGDKGKFAPNRVLTRAEVAALLQAIENLNMETVVPSDNAATSSTTTSVPTTSSDTSATEVTPAAPTTSSDTSAIEVTPAAPTTSSDSSATEVTPAAPTTSSDTSATEVTPAAPSTSSDTSATEVTPVAPTTSSDTSATEVTPVAPSTSSEVSGN
jgi:hypothetical protein